MLLAEDNPINQEVALELLQEAGLLVDLAVNGRIACEMAANNAYDLILMDVQMPEMDGIAASLAIRQLPGREKTPILAMTANAFEEDRQACLAAGMNDHIPKPVNPNVLFSAMLRWIAMPTAHDIARPKVVETASSKDSAEALRGRLAGISGLDLAAGLDNVQNKLPFYLRQLRHFTERHADEAVNIQHLLAAGDLQAAQIAAHSLKGASATLGVTQISQVAAAIELPLKQKTANTAEQLAVPLQQLAEQLARFIAEVQAVVPASSPNLEFGLSPYSAEHLRAVIDTLSNLLAEGNIQSQVYLHDHRAELYQALGREVAEVLSRDVEVFAFDKALEALRCSRD